MFLSVSKCHNTRLGKQVYHLLKDGDSILQSMPLVDKRNVLKVAAIASEVVNTLLVSFSIERSLQTLHTNKRHDWIIIIIVIISGIRLATTFSLALHLLYLSLPLRHSDSIRHLGLVGSYDRKLSSSVYGVFDILALYNLDYYYYYYYYYHYYYLLLLLLIIIIITT